ncbi:MAG: MmgE/PrpD family protein [Armatimonadota bacterium]|jgi:2-methylcitrate dehydratase PrpD
MTLTGALSELAINTARDALEGPPRLAARRMTLDALACALAGWDAPGVGEVVDQVRAWGGAEEASLLIHGDRLPAPNAAFANSAMVHALDYDDVHIPGTLHIMSVVLPAALAAAEMAEATGRELLDAVTIGVEVAARPAIWCKGHPKRPLSHAILPTSVFGGFGAVAAAARLRGLSTEQCVNAMGLFYAQASGNRQALHDRTLAKRLQPGFAAQSALWATALATCGVTGPSEALEGESGLLPACYECEPPTAEELMIGRARWEIERVSVKRHTSCGSCHPCLHAAERLREEQRLSPGEIARVEVFGHRAGGFVSKPLEFSRDPQVAAQFSVQYCVAYALLRGPQRLEDWTDAAILADTQVADLARSVTFADVPDDAPDPLPLPADFPPNTIGWQGVIVHTTDGRRLMRAECPAEVFAPDAVSEDDLRVKFHRCAEFSGLRDATRAQTLLASVESLARGTPAHELLRPWWSLAD